MRRLVIVFIVLCCGAMMNPAAAKDGDDLYKNTLSFLSMLAYGEHKQDIGLRFSWRQSGDRWVPDGNGFVFLSEGLGVYDYDGVEISNKDFNRDGLWHVGKDIDNDKNEILTGCTDGNVVKFVSMDQLSDTITASLYVELLPLKNDRDSIVPARIAWTGTRTMPTDSIEFAGIIDQKDGYLYLSFVNLLSCNLTAYVDNTPYPSSRSGIRSVTVAHPGDENVKPEISDIIMDGCVILPPYSFSLFKFAIKEISHHSQQQSPYE